MAFNKKRKDLPELTSENLQMYKRVWNTYIADKWKWLTLSIVLMLLAASFDALLVRQLKPIFDEVFIDKNKEVLMYVGLSILVLYFFKGVFGYLQSVVMTKLSIRVIADMQRDIFKRLIRMDYSFYQDHSTGEIITRFTSDVAMVKDAVLNSLTTFVRDTASVMFLVVLMFFQSFEMACVVFFVFPLGILPVVICGRKMRKKTKKNQEAGEGFFNVLTQSFRGIKIVKSYCAEDKEFQELDKIITKMNKLSFSMACLHAMQSPLMEFLGGIAMSATLGYGGYQIVQGDMTTGNFMVFLLAIVAAYKPMKNVANLHMRMQMGVASMDRLFTMLDIEPTIKEIENAKELVVTKGEIQVKNISFSYDGECEVLHDISFDVKADETVAFVGHSGSGKSTMINFFPRFYDPDKGQLFIDGQDISTVTFESLRKNIAYVSQDVILFNDTIKNNIRYGCPDATDEQVIEASKAAAAHGFIEKLDDGYDTVLGEQGAGLSGGQRQMISIARAMLKNAPILLLDEATSALDSQSEKVVQDSLEILMKGRTSLVVAHRLSTVINADKICVFNEGSIIDSGTHDELLAHDGIYAQLYKIQFMKN